MRSIPVSSQAIASVGYDGGRHALEIEFTSGGVYRYEAVPPKVYEELMSAESHGRYFMARVRDVYRYAKLIEGGNAPSGDGRDRDIARGDRRGSSREETVRGRPHG